MRVNLALKRFIPAQAKIERPKSHAALFTGCPDDRPSPADIGLFESFDKTGGVGRGQPLQVPSTPTFPYHSIRALSQVPFDTAF